MERTRKVLAVATINKYELMIIQRIGKKKTLTGTMKLWHQSVFGNEHQTRLDSRSDMQKYTD